MICHTVRPFGRAQYLFFFFEIFKQVIAMFKPPCCYASHMITGILEFFTRTDKKFFEQCVDSNPNFLHSYALSLELATLLNYR